jgi:hypothetical protein
MIEETRNLACYCLQVVAYDAHLVSLETGPMRVGATQSAVSEIVVRWPRFAPCVWRDDDGEVVGFATQSGEVARDFVRTLARAVMN